MEASEAISKLQQVSDMLARLANEQCTLSSEDFKRQSFKLYEVQEYIARNRTER